MTNLLSNRTSDLLHSALAALSIDEETDVVHYGVKGMKWGIRKKRESGGSGSGSDDKTSSGNASKGGGSNNAEKKPASKSGGSNPGLKALTGEETSAGRYARLQAEAKGGGHTNWSEQDLKFFNARTEALTKVTKMYEQKPNWVVETLKDTAKQQARNALNQYANKMVTDFVGQATKKKEAPSSIEDIANKKIADMKRDAQVKALIDQAFDGGGTRIKQPGSRAK